jgi:hypothetical protein
MSWQILKKIWKKNDFFLGAGGGGVKIDGF